MKSSSTLRLQMICTHPTLNSPLPFTSCKLPLPAAAPNSRVTSTLISTQRQIMVCYRKTNRVKIEKPVIPQLSHRQHCQQNPRRELACQHHVSSGGYSRFIIVGAFSLGLALLLMGADDHQKAVALGPEGPLMEEFWDNVRRYALYALTVSTGAIYTIFQPILELLKNPISAILILVIIGGIIFIVSQVLSAMVGVSDFTYNYGY